MKTLAAVFMPLFLLGAVPGLVAEEAAPKRITLSVRDADWKDVLRAALESTELNLSFEVGLDTRVQGLDLKGVTLEELLDQILPSYGLGYVRQGRFLHIVKADGGLRFYPVDSLSQRRSGSKEFSVNASGQVIQATGGGSSGGAGHSSAYVSTLQTASGTDPWQELQQGLATLVFGDALPASLGAAAEKDHGPAPASYSQGGKTLLINPGSGVVGVAADAGTQRRVAQFLAELQRRYRRQVLLEARIVEVTLGSGSQIGMDWNGILSAGATSGGTGTSIRGTLANGDMNSLLAAGGGLTSLVVQNARVTAALSALATQGTLQVLSAPRLSTLNNQKAILRVVREEAYFLMNSQTTGTGTIGGPMTTVNITPLIVPVGIVLDIQPQIADNGGITLAVNPSVSEIVGDRTYGSDAMGARANLPVVDRRDLDTVVHMQSGETLVLAGIIKAKQSDDARGVPWLRRLPILGDLFSKKEKSKVHTELAIFITATLVEDAEQREAVRKKVTDRLGKAGTDLDPQPESTPSLKLP